MKLEIYKEAAFARDVPERGIKKGDVATIIDYLSDPEPGYTLEVFDALGHTVDVLSVPEYYMEAIVEGERVQVRQFEAA
ncbi:MAG TPA: DUF4926 domain-containing protein [Candidatus Kapabacteria bacterium]|jgi:hypothetical protein